MDVDEYGSWSWSCSQQQKCAPEATAAKVCKFTSTAACDLATTKAWKFINTAASEDRAVVEITGTRYL